MSRAPFRSRIDSGLVQDVGDRGPANPMAEVVECSLDSRVAPAWILASHSDDQVSDDLHDPGPTRRAALVSPLLCNELSRNQNLPRLNDRRHLQIVVD